MCLALDWRTFGKKGQNMAHFHGLTGGKGGGSYANIVREKYRELNNYKSDVD